MEILIIFAIIIALALWALAAYFMKCAAEKKGYGPDDHIWAICFWLAPFGYLYVIALPDKKVQDHLAAIRKELTESSDELPEL